jgi:hypothetical protein
VGALRALGVPIGAKAVRGVAVVELVVGGLALAVTSAVVGALVALSYMVFAAVLVAALWRDVPIDTCGCLGRLETPPSWPHVLVVVAVLVGAVVEAADPSASLLERLGDDGGAGVLFAVATFVLTGVAVLVMRTGRRPSRPR